MAVVVAVTGTVLAACGKSSTSLDVLGPSPSIAFDDLEPPLQNGLTHQGFGPQTPVLELQTYNDVNKAADPLSGDGLGGYLVASSDPKPNQSYSRDIVVMANPAPTSEITFPAVSNQPPLELLVDGVDGSSTLNNTQLTGKENGGQYDLRPAPGGKSPFGYVQDIQLGADGIDEEGKFLFLASGKNTEQVGGDAYSTLTRIAINDGPVNIGSVSPFGKIDPNSDCFAVTARVPETQLGLVAEPSSSEQTVTSPPGSFVAVTSGCRNLPGLGH